MSTLLSTEKIYVAGHRGMVGSAIIRQLEKKGCTNILYQTHNELDLCTQSEVRKFFSNNAIDRVILAAAKVGGIHANNEYPAEFIYQNLMIEANIIHEAWKSGVKRLLFLGSSCIYPKLAEQPMTESALLTGELELTNEPYAIAKISGIKLCESYNRQYNVDYRSVMPTNLYGENDNFHPYNSHVIPAMMRRFHEAKKSNAKEVTVWGTGTPMREFLHVDDMADASIHVLELSTEEYQSKTKPMQSHINVGTGIDCTIRELAQTMAEVVNFEGKIIFDSSMPDGTPRKLMDVSRLKSLNWESKITLKEGLNSTYQWFISNESILRGNS